MGHNLIAPLGIPSRLGPTRLAMVIRNLHVANAVHKAARKSPGWLWLHIRFFVHTHGGRTILGTVEMVANYELLYSHSPRDRDYGFSVEHRRAPENPSYVLVWVN